GQAAGDRDVLAQVDAGVRGPAGVHGKQPGRPQHQVGLVERQRPGALTLHGQRERVAGAGGHLVEQAHRVVDGGQFVVAVRLQVTDVQVKVDLRWDADL